MRPIRIAILCSFCWLAPTFAQKPNPDKVLPHFDAMQRQGSAFDPAPLLELRVEGMRGILDRIFPETTEQEKPVDPKIIYRLIAQLSDDSFAKREDASTQLRRIGRPHIEILRTAATDDDPEVASRARKILDDWKGDSPTTANLHAAFGRYLEKLTDVPSQRELARRTTLALQERLDLTPKEKVLKQCLGAIARSHNDEVHNELLPLLKHEDPAVPMFAMRSISGRTGNSYVARIHMGAMNSGRRELVKCALRCIPCPVWDRRSKPEIREVYVKIFEAKDEAWDFSDDADFMWSSAFVAARDFRMEKGRDYLLDLITSKDPKESLRGIQALGDTYYRRNPVYPELLEKVVPHLKSPNSSFRAAAIYTLGVYKGDAIAPLLIPMLADADKGVWQTAHSRLLDQHSFHRNGVSPLPKLVRQAMKDTNDTETKSRYEKLLSAMKSSNPLSR